MKFDFQSLSKLKIRYRKAILMLADFLLIVTSYFTAWIVLVRRISIIQALPAVMVGGVCFVVVFFFVYWFFGMYESLWRYAEAHEFIKCLIATIVSAGIFTGATLLYIQPPRFAGRIPITVYFLSLMLAGLSTLFLRLAYRAYRTTRTGAKITSGMKKVMIVGAGETGDAVLRELYHEQKRRYDVICFVDDDPGKIGRRIQRIKVEGATKDIPRLVEKHGIVLIILAIPSATKGEWRRITNICAKTKCQVKKVPNLFSIVTDAQSIVSQIKDVSVEDLLGRDIVDISDNDASLSGKVVMVTGAGGSIGAELCRQIVRHTPKRLVMIDICENGLYDIQQELLRGKYKKVSLHAEVASVRDELKIELLFRRYQPEIVYHAAAHKHVPLMESAPEEAVKNNIFGTLNVARCADRHLVTRFVLISTDKAVNPTSVMGATKRVCEMIVQSMDKVSRTCFTAVRFGNVLGSNGSVIPLFKDQIAAGGPVTVTDPEIIRYFMTISEAVSLVMAAGELARGGEIFVLDMGDPVKILDLAESLIRMSGYEPYKEIDIQFIGLRPGEKLFEELLTDEEDITKTQNQKIFIGTPIDISPEFLFETLTYMKATADENDMILLAKQLHTLVPGYSDTATRSN